MESELLPCPFCGGDAVIHNGGVGCDAQYSTCPSPDVFNENIGEAIKQWNARAALPERKVDGEVIKFLTKLANGTDENGSRYPGYEMSWTEISRRAKAALQSHESGLPEPVMSEPVSLDRCAEALFKSHYGHMEDWEQDEYRSRHLSSLTRGAKSVLDAAGIKYVE